MPLNTRRTAVFFDFDGVILESVEVKADAFVRLFADQPQHAPAIRALHRRCGGISRRRKIEMIRRDILGRPDDPEQCDLLARRFGELAAAGVRACPLTPGARETLERLSRRLPLYIVSGTPEEELREIVAARGLAPLFRGVYGSPREKPEILRAVTARIGCDVADCVFIGDAPTDSAAAAAVGMPFIGRVPAGEASPFAPLTPTVADLAGLAALPPFARVIGRPFA